MITLDEEYIKSLPLVTNRIDVSWDREKFFSKYIIVSYFSKNREHNLPYEQLADTSFLSVTGIRARWGNSSSVRFFVLVEIKEKDSVLQALREYDDVVSSVDMLENYDNKVVCRIIASLAINALGKRKSKTLMYNDGALLVCDEKNFGIRSKAELVCLRIEVNEYLNLTAKTNSFSHPKTGADLLNHRGCTFRISNDIGGYLWGGQSVKPVVVKKNTTRESLDEYYIKKKRFPNSKNAVPYWPYNKDNYTHGRLFAITQVLESANELFDDIVRLDFAESDVIHYDACKTGDDMLDIIRENLSGDSLFVDDPFGTKGSKEMVESLANQICNLVGDSVTFHEEQQVGDIVIKLCEPITEAANLYYEQALDRMSRGKTVLQHCIYDDEEKNHLVDKSKARRILIEILVKKSLKCNRMPDALCPLIRNWKFTRYKVCGNAVHGASLSVDNDGKLAIKEHGLSFNPLGEDYKTFCREILCYENPDLIKGRRDYMALQKNGNVYLIIDTDEIPILDAMLIDEGYGRVINEGESLSMFKRKKVAHEYLRGYIGFHLWKSEGLEGEADGSYSYIAGTNSENMKILSGTKMDKMPRARRIFILHTNDKSSVEGDIMEIVNMLKSGFGRWNELMTYPFPFKYLQEYLDDVCEITFSTHWGRM